MNIPLHVDLPESPILKRHHVHIIATEAIYIVFCALSRDMLQELPQKRTVRRWEDHLGDLLWIWIHPSNRLTLPPRNGHGQSELTGRCQSSELLISCVTALCAPRHPSPPVWVQGSEPNT